MDVLNLHIRLAAEELYIGEIPESPDAQGNETVRRLLGDGLRDGQHHHVYAVRLDKRVQLVHMENGNMVDLGSDQRGRDIESSIHREAGGGKRKILQQGVTQVANTDHDQVVIIVHPQDPANLRMELLHVIAVTLLAELADAAQVLADLGGGDVHLLP